MFLLTTNVTDRAVAKILNHNLSVVALVGRTTFEPEVRGKLLRLRSETIY